MAIPGRRYTISGTGYGIEGKIERVAGDTDVPLDAFLMPCVLASDAVVKDGELIGDPTEGALVVLGEKGGVSAVATREAYPRVATLPFDADYKMMATFHRMKDEAGKDVVRCFVKGAPDQLLARADLRDHAGPGRRPARRRRHAEGLPRRERAPGRQGPAGHGDRPQGLRPGHLRPRRRPAAAPRRDDPPRARRHRRPAAAGGQEVDRGGPRGRDPGPDDHRRPRRHRRGDRPRARHPGPRHHRCRVPGDERRARRSARSTTSASSPASPRRTRSTSSTSCARRATSSP